MTDNIELNNSSEFDELEALFGQLDTDTAKMEQVMLTQNLEGFASCFPEWDLHPPIRNRK